MININNTRIHLTMRKHMINIEFNYIYILLDRQIDRYKIVILKKRYPKNFV